MIQARRVDRNDAIGHNILVVAIITAVSQADVLAYAFVPGHAFEIVGAEGYCRTEAGVCTADVKIQAVSALNAVIAFATATRVEAVLATALASRRGSKTDAINVHFTTDGTGALTNGFVTVRYRPTPMAGDISSE